MAALVVATVTPLLVSAGAGAGALTPPGRQSRTSDAAIAGGDIYIWSSHSSESSGSGCTVSFAVRLVKTGARGVLTAGHCVGTLSGGPAYLVHQTERLAGDDTAPGDLLGRVTASRYRLGADGDSAFVQLAPGVSTAPVLFVGGAKSHATMPVVGIGPLAPGTKLCYSGAATGEHCGFTVQGGSQTLQFDGSGSDKVTIGNEWRAYGTDCTSRKGDSGSPVYTRIDGKAYAVGILSGGQAKAGGCPFYFTPVTLALRQLGLKLLTSSVATS
jgi:Trypsin